VVIVARLNIRGQDPTVIPNLFLMERRHWGGMEGSVLFCVSVQAIAFEQIDSGDSFTEVVLAAHPGL